MLKKLSVIALLALVIIPAGVMAAGTQAQGAGSGTMSAGGQQFQQQSDGGQAFMGQNSYSNQNGFVISADKGNGTLTRDRTCEQIHLRTFAQLQTMTQDQSQTQNQSQSQLNTQTQSQLQSQLMTQTQNQLQTMTRIQSRLMDGSCGNCPRLTTTV
jgi:hypothetical protein